MPPAGQGPPPMPFSIWKELRTGSRGRGGDHGVKCALRGVRPARGWADEGGGRALAEFERELAERDLRVFIERRDQLPGDGVRFDLALRV